MMRLLSAKVMHKRLQPVENTFCYSVYYIVVGLSALEDGKLSSVLGGFHSFDEASYGYRDGRHLREWLEEILRSHDQPLYKDVTLISMPRVLGFVFNPVSFYACWDNAGNLRAVICEVSNTFGERHSYICSHSDKHPIERGDWLEAKKNFHVSPFLERSGSYQFCFDLAGDSCSIGINHIDKDSNKMLLTTLQGSYGELSKASLRRAFFWHPLVTLKVVILIHYQAYRLLRKGIKYIKKPLALKEKVTKSGKNAGK